jgi:hypothetical protein
MQAIAAAVMMMFFSATLNPDGSGKAVIEMMQSAPASTISMSEKGTVPPQALKDFAKRVLDQSAGVEAWADVSVGSTDGGRTMTFKGTAYFKDLSKVKPSAPPGAPSMPSLSWAADPKGGMILSLDPAMGMAAVATKPQELTAEKLAEKVKTYQDMWAARRRDTEAKLAGVKVGLSFKLPGPATDVSGLTAASDGALVFTLDGQKLFRAADELVKDSAYVGQCIKEGRKPADDRRDPILAEKMFGSKGPWTARVTGDVKPPFDYAAEAKAAKDAYPSLLEKLGLTPPPSKLAAEETSSKK